MYISAKPARNFNARPKKRKGQRTPFGEKLQALTNPVFCGHRPGTPMRRMLNETYTRNVNMLGKRFTARRSDYQPNGPRRGRSPRVSMS